MLGIHVKVTVPARTLCHYDNISMNKNNELPKGSMQMLIGERTSLSRVDGQGEIKYWPDKNILTETCIGWYFQLLSMLQEI